jgi:hypothetical protein
MKHIRKVMGLALFVPLMVQAQSGWFGGLQKQFSDYTSRTYEEKIYVHQDRPLYVVGETMWFKAYYVEAGSRKPASLSKIAYLEVLDQEQNPVAQTQIALAAGQGEGHLALPTTLSSGTYTVRSYTNWMKNFGPNAFFETAITVLNPFVKPETQASDLAPGPAYALQFFPEGGHLVGGTENRVAFRAIGKDGRGIDFRGVVLNQKNDTLLRFEPRRFGIGRFTFTPDADQQYRAVVRDQHGQELTYPLPDVQRQGYAMLVQEGGLGKIQVAIAAPAFAASEVFLLAHTPAGVAYTEARRLENGRAVFEISQDKLTEGITHLTVFNQAIQPVCERLYYKKPTRTLAINALTNKTEYATREKVSLSLTASAAPAAQLSVAVYLLDSLPSAESASIGSYLWLTSDLRGTVESPEYYTQATGPEAGEALDNLLLTHGWSRYRWEEILAGQAPAFTHLPEREGHFVRGRIFDTRTSQPAERVSAFLAAPDQRAQLFVGQSDSLGYVRFEVKKLFDKKEVIVQTNTRQDTTYRFELSTPYAEQVSSRRWPQAPYRVEQGAQLLTRSINMQTLNAFIPQPQVTAEYTGTDTLAFFGKPDAKYFLDAYTRFPTMEEVMREYVPGVFVRKRQGKFHFLLADRVTPQGIFNQDPLILLDGVPVFSTDRIMEFDPLKVKKLEVVNALYYLGHLSFSGMVSYTTYKGDLAGFPLDPRALVQSYQFAQSRREFYAPRYEDAQSRESRLPDFRNLLHWSPTLTTDAQGKGTLDFYTSDQTGTYRVVVQGLTADGSAGSQTFTFEVKPGVRQ